MCVGHEHSTPVVKSQGHEVKVKGQCQRGRSDHDHPFYITATARLIVNVTN